MAFASGDIHLDKAPTKLEATSSRCSAGENCSSTTACLVTALRRCVTIACRNIGLTEQQIKDNLIFTGAKGGRCHDQQHEQEGCTGGFRCCTS